MSNNTYTITVILKAFFADCRAQAKIFINENIKTILDLENKISRIFGVKDFHLLSNEKLLPSCEDVRLLENGDIVCVLPNESQPNLLLLPERFYLTNSKQSECKMKKRQSLVDECPLKEKKCKKKRKETASSSDEKPDELYEHKLTKTTTKLSNRKKSKNRINISNILQPGHNECLVSTSTPNAINNNICDDFNITHKNNIVLVDEENQSCEKVEKVKNKKCKTAKEHSSMRHHEKSKDNQLLSQHTMPKPEIKIIEQNISEIATENVKKESTSNKNIKCEYVHDITTADSPTTNNFAPKCRNKTKDMTNLKLESSANDSLLKMIVDDSSSSCGNETKEEISNNLESNIVKESSTNTSKSEIEKKKTVKYPSNESKHTNNDDSVKSQIKTFSLYKLPAKKKNCKSWSTSPLLKKTNHVTISRVPIVVSNIDSSRFVFRDSDVGAVPVPNNSEGTLENSNFNPFESISKSESVGEDIRNDILSSALSEPLINISQGSLISLLPKKNSSTAEVPLTDNDMDKTETHTFSKEEICAEKQNIKEFYQSLYINQSMASTPIQTNMKKCKTIIPSISDEITAPTDCGNFNEAATNKDIVLKNWRQNVLDKLTNSTQNSLHNTNKTCTVVNESLALNKDEVSGNPSDGVSSTLVKLNTNSGIIKKRNILNRIGVNYYLKLLNKIDWDVTKSVSDVRCEETNCLSENKELNRDRKSTEIVKNEKALDNLDLSSVSSAINDFVTKRKRKRKHKKKVRVDTPVSRKINNAVPSKNLSLIEGTPKVHIRFQSEENGFPFEDNNEQTSEASVNFDKPNEKIKILQNLSLDISKQNEQNIAHVESTPTQTENEENISSVVISTRNNMNQGIKEQTLGDFSIQSDNRIKVKSSSQLSRNLSESLSDNEEKDSDVFNQSFPSITTGSSERKMNESGFQRIALDYTSGSLTSNENNRCILNLSCGESKLSKTCRDEALGQAKAALLKAVGFETSDDFSDTIRRVDKVTIDSNDSCIDLSIVDITDN